jgi:purine-binding chemotaxis protein CheW
VRTGQNKATLAPDPTSQIGEIAVLAVSASNEVYGFPLSAIREILVPPPIAEVPRAPSAVLGVISVRGQIITVVDLPSALNLESHRSSDEGRILLLDIEDELIGVAVDHVVQVYRMDPSQIEYASAMSAELSDYVVGIGRVSSDDDSDEVLILLDPVSVLGGVR